MQILAILALCYVAVGAVLFAHPAAPAVPEDFNWQRQIEVFRASLPLVMAWPLCLWRLGRARRGD